MTGIAPIASPALIESVTVIARGAPGPAGLRQHGNLSGAADVGPESWRYKRPMANPGTHQASGIAPRESRRRRRTLRWPRQITKVT